MVQHTNSNNPEVETEARRRLALHESLTGEMLDHLASEDWDTYQDGKQSFESYAEDYTWWHRSIFRIYLTSGQASEHLDVYVDDRLEPYRVVFHLELPAARWQPWRRRPGPWRRQRRRPPRSLSRRSASSGRG